ncbi:MAG: ferrochelatase [Desulfofustis sp.]|nr:ferrochelatase [Desulfofustis sp.]
MKSDQHDFSDHTAPTGVLLLNMGGPEKPQDIRPFLYNIFSDREIIRLGPPFLQKPLAWFIARKRAPKSEATYARIGGGSPITRITMAQQQALQEKLNDHGEFCVATAMRYWSPTTREALKSLAQKPLSRLVALSLYPHYSCATSGSSLNELKRWLLEYQIGDELIEIDSWPDHPGYVACLADRITQGLQKFGSEPVELVYSAHSLPVSFIEEGDPYVDHLQRTITAVEKITGVQGRICYQSRSGPVEWLSPSTPETIKELGAEGCTNILMVPISFVSDHVETLVEINMDYRDLAADCKIRLETSPSFNDDPDFIDALTDIVLQSIEQE